MNIRFDITPVPKPRMTQRDQWKDRSVVGRYYAYKDQLRFAANAKGFREVPGEFGCLVFNMPMPASWSQKKKEEMNGQPHQQTPDLDNLLKGFMDALCYEDKHIHSIGELKKLWSESGSIELCFEGSIPDRTNYKAYNYLKD